jgi:sigma-B regulation protein RsbU (phosphoserine phosphatase)
MVVEPDGRQLRYLNAGHPPALVRDGAALRRLAATGPPLGLLPDQRYETGELRLGDDASLLLYSDGLTEATDAAGRELGIDGVAELLREVSGDDAEVAVDRILAGVIAHGGNDPERDDRTLLLVRTVHVGR